MFSTFQPVYVINLKHREDRKNNIKKIFEENNISNYTFIDAIDGRKKINHLIDTFPQHKKTTKVEIASLMSQIKAINHWINTSDSEYAIICEDDLSFETIKYWNFSWDDFYNSLNINFDILQLCVFFVNPPQIKLHKRTKKEYSAAIYLIKKDYAKTLINKFIKNNKFYLDYPPEELVGDHFAIYKKDKCYSIPLFVPDLSFGTDAQSYDEDNKESLESIMDPKIMLIYQKDRVNEVLSMWKKNNLSLKELTSISE